MLGRLSGLYKTTENAQRLVSINGVLVGAGGGQGEGEEWGVRCAGFWGIGEQAPRARWDCVVAPGMSVLGDLGLWWGGLHWESPVGAQNEELQPREKSNTVVQPGLCSQRGHGCAQALLQGEVAAGCSVCGRWQRGAHSLHPTEGWHGSLCGRG